MEGRFSVAFLATPITPEMSLSRLDAFTPHGSSKQFSPPQYTYGFKLSLMWFSPSLFATGPHRYHSHELESKCIMVNSWLWLEEWMQFCQGCGWAANIVIFRIPRSKHVAAGQH